MVEMILMKDDTSNIFKKKTCNDDIQYKIVFIMMILIK